jgi:hypothetical protein
MKQSCATGLFCLQSLERLFMKLEDSAVPVGAVKTLIHDENGNPVRVILDEQGPNGGPIGLNQNGDQVEVPVSSSRANRAMSPSSC